MRLIEIHYSKFDLRKFEADCKPFLEAWKGSKHPLYHGSSATPKDWDIVQMKESRAPRDTPRALHDAVNDIFQEKFGWRARENGIFTNSDFGEARVYGDVSVIFPIGEFKYVWSPFVTDMTALYHVYKRENSVVKGQPHDEAKKNAIESMKEQIAKLEWCYNKRLDDAVNETHEIILGCKSFYMLRHNETYWDTVRPFLMNEGYLK